jgi:hypothetical protein
VSSLSANDRTKLIKFLGLLGSTHAGERDSAGLAAQRLMRQRGLSWAPVLNPPQGEYKLPELGKWRVTCRRLLEKPQALKPWELGFVRDLPCFGRISVKQRYILKEIADRVLGGATH